MSGITSALATVERILTVAGPLLASLVGKDNEKMAKQVLDATAAAIDYARMAIDGGEHFASELTEIATDLEEIKARGGVTEGDFDALSNRIGEKTARLVAAVKARQS